MPLQFVVSIAGIIRIFAKVLVVPLSLIIFFSCHLSKQMQSQNLNTAGASDSLLIDRIGNEYPVKVLLDGNLWMTTNLNTNIPNSFCYENEENNCRLYGRLYVWQTAVLGCKLFGGGWRLPSDSEWNQLVKLYGGDSAVSLGARQIAYKNLLPGGSSGFNALFGGGRAPDNVYGRLDAHGFYWTGTDTDSSSAWYYNFAKGSQALYQQDGGEKTSAFSVRCIKSLVLNSKKF